MNAIRKAAPTWRGGHGSKTHCASVTNDTHNIAGGAPWQADLILEIWKAAGEIATTRAHADALTQEIESLLNTIADARKAAAACLSTDGQAHYRRRAEDAANEADALLGIRMPSPVTLSQPGRRVPPTVPEIRRALDRHRKITAARVEVLEARVEVCRAFLREDGSWERAWSAEGDAERKLDAMERYEDG